MGLSLPVSARLITLFPSELDFGSTPVGEMSWRDVRFRYSGPDSGIVEIKINYVEPDNIGVQKSTPITQHHVRHFGVHKTLPQAIPVYATVAAIFNAVKMHRQDLGEDPPSLERLIELAYIEIPDSLTTQWNFSLVGQDPVIKIEAVSTAEMPDGAGHTISFDIQTGIFDGWGVEFDGKFELSSNEVRTVEVWFLPGEVEAYGDTLDVVARTSHGYEERHQIICTGQGALDVIENGSVPESFGLSPAFPNPFNSTTSISFSLPNSSVVRLSIVRLDGKEVAVLKDGFSTAGNFSYSWDGGETPAGTYYARLVSGNRQTVRQILLIR